MSDSDETEGNRTSGPSNSALLDLIVESSTDFAIFTTNLEGTTTSWNVGAERLFGFKDTEMLGSSADVIFTAEDRAAGAPTAEREQAQGQGRAIDERWHLRSDGSRFWASGILTPLKSGDGFVKIARDLSEQHLANTRLLEQEERFRVLATNIPQLVFRTKSDGHRTWPSPQWIDFTGLGFQESLGLGWLEAVHPDDRQGTVDAWRTAEVTREYYAEQRVWKSADGEYRWHQTRANPLQEPNSGDDWVGTMTDIHELRELQSRQHILMAELQHRTRNLLAVVQAIASQTLRSNTSIKTFKGEFEQRLRALSRIQSLLATVDYGDVDLRSLLEAELFAHAAEAVEAEKLSLAGPPVSLPATSAQALALGIHELATNALKYGAIGQPSGRLDVSWAVEADELEPKVTLLWEESGVQMADNAALGRKGYGRELIEQALPYQLRAKTKLEFRADGVRCVIAVPIKANTDAGRPGA